MVKVLVTHGIGNRNTLPQVKQKYAQLMKEKPEDVHFTFYANILNSSNWDKSKRGNLLKWFWKLDMWEDRVDDVLAFFLDEDTRNNVISTIQTDLLVHRPKYIVAHSLGSVAVLMALKQAGIKAIPMPTLILCGSPMAMLTVRWFVGDLKSVHAKDIYALSGEEDPVAKFGKSQWHPNRVTHISLPNQGHDFDKYLESADLLIY